MIRPKTIYLLFFFAFLLPHSCLMAQFLDMQLDIEPELTVSVLQPLNFGTVITNSGITSVSPGEPGMGVFTIDAINTQKLLLHFEKPDELTHEENEDSIPVEINASFTEYDRDNAVLAQPIVNNPEEIILRPLPGNETGVWSKSYIYIYGNITVGNIPEGIYSGELVLNITYE